MLDFPHVSIPHLLSPLMRRLALGGPHPRITIMGIIAGKDFPRAVDPSMRTILSPREHVAAIEEGNVDSESGKM